MAGITICRPRQCGDPYYECCKGTHPCLLENYKCNDKNVCVPKIMSDEPSRIIDIEHIKKDPELQGDSFLGSVVFPEKTKSDIKNTDEKKDSKKAWYIGGGVAVVLLLIIIIIAASKK